MKNIKVVNNVFVLYIDLDKNIRFIVLWFDIKVYKYESNINIVKILLEFFDWCLRGFCYMMNGDFLVSMCFLDEK